MKTILTIGSLNALKLSTQFSNFFSTGTNKLGQENKNISNFNLFVLYPIDNNNIRICSTPTYYNDRISDENKICDYIIQNNDYGYLYIITNDNNNNINIQEEDNGTEIIRINKNAFIKLLKKDYQQLTFNEFQGKLLTSVFLLVDCLWEDFYSDLIKNNIKISGGDISKWYFLSPEQFKLSSICCDLGIGGLYI